MLDLVLLNWEILALAFAVFGVIGHVVLWVLYIAVMALKRVRDEDPLAFSHPVVSGLGFCILVIGLLLDVVLNVIYQTLICLELPREATISARLKRYNQNPNEWAWRRKVAAFFEPLLDPFDPSGDHI